MATQACILASARHAFLEFRPRDAAYVRTDATDHGRTPRATRRRGEGDYYI